jgi:small-conductance mechanosensitive channel
VPQPKGAMKILSVLSAWLSAAALVLLFFVFEPHPLALATIFFGVISLGLAVYGLVTSSLSRGFRVTSVVLGAFAAILVTPVALTTPGVSENLIGVALVVLIWGTFAVLSSLVGRAAERKGRSRRTFFWLSLVFAPLGILIMGVIVAVMAPPQFKPVN